MLVDVPSSFAQHIVQAVAETTSEPIMQLVYSHIHADHIGGAGLIRKQVLKLQILAEDGTANFLREMQDPNRPVPTQTFKDHDTLKLGSLTADTKVGHWQKPEGDLLSNDPDKKVLMAIDLSHRARRPSWDLTSR